MFGAMGGAMAKSSLAKVRAVVQFFLLVFLLCVVCVIGRLWGSKGAAAKPVRESQWRRQRLFSIAEKWESRGV